MDTSKKATGFSEAQADLMAQLQAAAALPDSAIDSADPDAAELPDWTDAVRGKFYRPTKTLKSLRVDSDVLAWFQSQGKGYQTRINQVLRAEMLRELAQAAKARQS